MHIPVTVLIDTRSPIAAAHGLMEVAKSLTPLEKLGVPDPRIEFPIYPSVEDQLWKLYWVRPRRVDTSAWLPVSARIGRP